MTNADWLKNVKAGDLVAYTARWDGISIGTVEKVTPTQIVVKGHRFRRDTGWLLGLDAYSSMHLVEPTPDVIKQVRTRRASAHRKARALWLKSAVQHLDAMRWKDLTDDAVVAVWEFVQKAERREGR